MAPVRIGLLGEMRAGKDTVGQMIADNLETYTFFNTFSSGIHEVIQEYLPDLYKEGKPRQALQQIGQLFRSFDQDVWINHLFKSEKFAGAYHTKQNIIVTDIRQPNEVKRLKELGFLIIKVTADKEVRYLRAVEAGDNFNTAMLQHETEELVNVCDFDISVDNSGTKGELEATVKQLIEDIKEEAYADWLKENSQEVQKNTTR